MSTTHATATLIHELETILESAPQGELDPCLIEELGQKVREALRLLKDEEPIWVDAPRAKQLLGIELDASVPYWVELGLLRGRTLEDGRVQVQLDDILLRRYETEVSMAVGGDEMTQDELDELSRSRPGTYPWQREQMSPPK
ncbi:MAG TPA: hypothetical protein VMM78_14640 [Thermomicrobiales bacterium]|nr:hypothetical protein [Thermomicrobiales bacterium]